MEVFQKTPQLIPENEHVISAFVGLMCAQVEDQERNKPLPQQSKAPNRNVGSSSNDEARKHAENAVIEAEKFQANIVTPPAGNHNMSMVNEQVTNMVVCGDSDENHRLYMVNDNMYAGQVNPPTQQVMMSITPNQMLPNIGSGISDDDFFHLTCHIEPSLIHKIEKGEFVELEKLLPKDRSHFTRGEMKKID